jgi:hypothetical protein
MPMNSWRTLMVVACLTAHGQALLMAPIPKLAVRPCMGSHLPQNVRCAKGPIAMASSASSSSLEQDSGSGRSRIVATLLLPLRLISAIARFLRECMARITMRGGFGTAASKTRERASSIAADSARSAANMVVVEGTATRSFAPPDEVLAFFNYRFSPFYAQLDGSADESSTRAAANKGATRRPGDTVEEGTATPVYWLQHRHAQPPTAAQLGLDRARYELLQELYDEASAAEKQQRGGGRWRGF